LIALRNTLQSLSSGNLFGGPSETDKQKDTDLDAFCFPPLKDDPEFDQKWFRKTVTDEVAASLTSVSQGSSALVQTVQ
jgi:hypothetical protein